MLLALAIQGQLAILMAVALLARMGPARLADVILLSIFVMMMLLINQLVLLVILLVALIGTPAIRQ